MRNLFRLVGLRHLRVKAVRTVLTTFGISLGIALFIAIKIINHSTLDSFRNSVEALAGKTTLTVTAGEAGFPEARLDQVAAVPGVTHAVPIVQSRAYFADTKNASQTMIVLGVDLLKEQSLRNYKTCADSAVGTCQNEQVIDDPLTFLNQADSIILTHSFARENGFHLDSDLPLATAHGLKHFKVRGLLSPSGPAKAYGGAIAIMDIDGARAMFGKEGKLDRIDVVTREGADVGQVAQRIRSVLGAGYRVEAPESQSQAMQRMVESFQAILTFFSTFALLVGLFLVTNSVSMSVAERKREIGTLRALGATRASILKMILSEAVAMGSVGAFFGAWMGRVLASRLVGMVTQSMSDQFTTHIDVARLNFTTLDVVRAIALGTVVSLFAAAVPASRAMRIAPLEAMRKHDSNDGERHSRLLGLSAWVAVAMLMYYQVSSVCLWGSHSAMLSALDQVCAVLGPALIGPVVVIGLIRFSRRIPGWNVVVRLAQDNLLRNPRRTGGNVMSLMIGLIFVTLVAVVNVSFTSTLTAWYDKVFNGDLVVSSNGNVLSMDVQPLHESVGYEISSVPGVDTSFNRGRYGIRFIHLQYGGKQLGLKALDPVDPDKKRAPFDMVDRDWKDAHRELYDSKEQTVLVSENFVFHFKKRTGDFIELPTPSGAQRFRIVGVVRDYASFEGSLYMARDEYKKLWRDPLVNAFVVYLSPGASADQVRKEIDRRMGMSHNLMVISFSELKAELVKTIGRSFAYLRAMEGAALLVGLIGLLNTLLMSILERTRELGMLRAIGMSRAMLSGMIFQEALIQGALGAVAAVILGSWIAHLWVTYSLTHLLGWMVRFDFPWGSIGTVILAGVCVAVGAGLFPARRAARLEITWALQYE